ncbi:MAG: transporter substrate-binding domain-containing protein [Undibacterium sp.]|nr:transporter substrate-binding domain-containing protein [Undibacterium sp.]
MSPYVFSIKIKSALVLPLFLSVLFAPTPSAFAADKLKILFETREPIAYRDAQGKLTGIIAYPVMKALTKANIAYEWVEMPFKRQIITIESNQETACALGLFKNAERMRYAKFSQAVTVELNRPSVLLMHKEFVIDKTLDLARVLSLPHIRLLKKEAASYGSVIDDAIERSRATQISTTAESSNMARMIAAKRADFIFVAEDEALRLIKSIPEGDQLTIFKPLNMPQESERFMMCSKLVADEVIARFNKALR